jgi:hypothetical protein
MQVESVNEYLFSLHLNSDLYAKLSLTQLALVYAHPYIWPLDANSALAYFGPKLGFE